MIVIALLGPAFVAGALAGVLALVVLAIHREDHGRHLPDVPPTRAAAAARDLMGVRVGGERPVIEACPEGKANLSCPESILDHEASRTGNRR